MRTSHILLSLLLAAALGLTLFGILAWRAVTFEPAGTPDALRRFSEARAALGPARPMLEVDPSGRVVRASRPPEREKIPLESLRLLVYRAGEERVVRADVPFWFFRLKGPAMQFALRGTGFDPERLGVTADDLERHGPGLVIDETRANGDRLLVWTE